MTEVVVDFAVYKNICPFSYLHSEEDGRVTCQHPGSGIAEIKCSAEICPISLGVIEDGYIIRKT